MFQNSMCIKYTSLCVCIIKVINHPQNILLNFKKKKRKKVQTDIMQKKSEFLTRNNLILKL